MSPRALIPVPVLLAVLAALPAPAAAAIEKAPGIGLDSSSLPLEAPGGELSYLVREGKRATRLLETPRDGGPALRALRLSGRFALPAVAYDGLPGGLSADGRTLILVNPRKRFPRASTTLAVIDAKRMRLRHEIRLSGDFSFDAISPDGRLLYLIQYLSKRDITDYAVRAYDMRARRLFPQPVVDPSEPDEDMSGEPLARVMGAGGRWAYTLYASEEHPFVHALDTARRTAVCIDLDVHGGDALAMRGDRLDVLGSDRVLASIDTSTHRVIALAAKRPAQRRGAEEPAGFPWLAIAGPTAALMLLAAVGRRRLAATRTAAP
jgi:hypothetical protein